MLKQLVLVTLLSCNSLLCSSLAVSAQGQVPPDVKQKLQAALYAIKKEQYPVALNILQPLAREGSPGAQDRLGLMYLRGEGVPQSAETAASWFQKGADHGYFPATYNLALMYAQGLGVKQDYYVAFGLFQKMAEGGDARAQCNLGIMYILCAGTVQNAGKAEEYLSLAAKKGQVNLDPHLYVMNMDDKPQCDKASAIAILNKLSKKGLVAAQDQLARGVDSENASVRPVAMRAGLSAQPR